MSCTRVDLPEPLTPVTQTSRPKGRRTSIPLRLFSAAPSTSSQLQSARRARSRSDSGGFDASFRPLRYSAVSEFSTAQQRGGSAEEDHLPAASRRARAPVSRMRSAASITCGSCSTTSSELPASRSRCRTPITRCMSRGCRPMLGSSRTKRVLTREVPSAVVRLMRCTSPPLRVRDWRSRVR